MALLVPSLAAGAVTPLAFTTTALAATGATVLEGHLAVVEAFTPTGEPVPGWTFNLTGAGRFDTKTEHRMAIDTELGGGGGAALPWGDETNGTFATSGTWRGWQWTDDSYVFVQDIPGRVPPTVTLDPLSMRLAAPEPECVHAQTKWANMPVPPCRQVGAATAGFDLGGRVTMRVRGAFQLVVWGWTLENDTHTVTTGRVEGEPVHDMTEPRVVPVDKTVAVGTYPDGDLALEVDASGLSRLFIEGLEVRTSGLIFAKDARDLLTQKSHGDLRLEGGTTLTSRPDQSRLAVNVVQQRGSVQVVAPPPPTDAEAAAVAAQPASGDGAPWPLIVASVALVAAVAAALLWWRHASAPLSRVTRAMDRGQHDQALAAAAASPLPAGSKRVLQAIALIKAERLDEAEGVVDDPDGGLEPAARHFLLATIAAARRLDDLARRHLRACFEHDEAYRMEAAMNGRLRRILEAEAAEPAGGREAYT